MSDKAAGKKTKYKRIVLKLSGEVLSGKSNNPIDAGVLERICAQVNQIHDMGVEAEVRRRDDLVSTAMIGPVVEVLRIRARSDGG